MAGQTKERSVIASARIAATFNRSARDSVVGVAAMPAASRDAEGTGASSSRPLRAIFAVLALAIAALLALFAPVASAAQTRLYTGVSFGPDGTAGTASFDNVQSIAVDQSSGDIYVYDAGAGEIFKFDSQGVFA
jgi:hypothetical protein